MTDLGQADDTTNYHFNYLDALGATDKSAFQSGSFERFSHPVPPGLPVYWIQGDVEQSSIGNLFLDSVRFASGNNHGYVVGVTSQRFYPDFNGPHSLVALFQPDPHTLQVYGSHEPASVQSPGYLSTVFMGGPVNSFYGTVSGINDHLMITGSQQKSPNWQETAPVLIDPTITSGTSRFVDLGSLGGKNGTGNALNNAGQVVGWSEIANGAHHAFLYDKGIMEDLNTLIPPTAGLNLESAIGIDASGRIVAFGTDRSGATHEYFLTPAPVPEPSTLAFFGLVAGSLVLRRQRRCGRINTAA
ncbi:PEP-CTERM sorting domain-containing protein [Singulisphaera sp. GP187]|uniref:PEP-CTERM sorting domain-containing protein n=1 Tax=Singulisphaera sp. GP187 TaxID=1882752 RepID=UPI0020B12BA0|nr:PEP-CTERM sorting domain-containing protein [Singulisphaera sp. GP187]